MSIDEYDFIHIESITTRFQFNEHAKYVSRKIAHIYIKKHNVDYDLHELFVFKMFIHRKKMDSYYRLDVESYKTFINQFISWVYYAIQDLGGTDYQADTYKRNFKSILKPNFNKERIELKY